MLPTTREMWNEQENGEKPGDLGCRRSEMKASLILIFQHNMGSSTYVPFWFVTIFLTKY